MATSTYAASLAASGTYIGPLPYEVSQATPEDATFDCKVTFDLATADGSSWNGVDAANLPAEAEFASCAQYDASANFGWMCTRAGISEGVGSQPSF